jgi:hypothetical protein
MRMRVTVVTVALSLLAGCGYNEGLLTSWSPGDKHQYRMDLSSVRYVRSVSGRASLGSIFCWGFPFAWGGFARGIPLDHGLYQQAWAALQEDAKLKPNEILKDLRIDRDPTCYLLYFVNDLTISADVYEVTAVGAAGQPGVQPSSRTSDSPPPVPVHPAGKLTYAQLQEAFAQVEADRDGTRHHEIAVRILGGPHKADAESDFWWGNLPGKADCFVLRLSATKGDSLDTAPNDKCK